MPFAKINGIDLYYEVHGKGPALVLAHGGGGNHLSWWQQVPALSKTCQVITFDHRSFGQSRDLPDGPGPRAFVQDLTALLDHVGIQKAAVVGQSMGGWTVGGFAATHPERTSALILCDTTGGVDTPEITREPGSSADQCLFEHISRTPACVVFSLPTDHGAEHWRHTESRVNPL